MGSRRHGSASHQLSGRQAVIEKAKHRITVGADGIGHGAASDGAWVGDPSAALGRHTKRRRQERKGVLPSEPQAAAALEEGLALARPTALSPTRHRTNYSPKTPGLNPKQPLYDHKGILKAQKSGQIKPTARQGPPAWPGCRSGPGARQRLRWLARNRWAALGTSQRG